MSIEFREITNRKSQHMQCTAIKYNKIVINGLALGNLHNAYKQEEKTRMYVCERKMMQRE